MIRSRSHIKLLSVITGILFICLFSHDVLSQDTYPDIKAFLTAKFGEYIQWPNEDKIDTFRIGVFGMDDEQLASLMILETFSIKEKPISIHHFTRLNDIGYTHILYLTRDKNSQIERLFASMSGKNTLLVSDRCNDRFRTMINFLPLKDNKADFEVNKANILNQELTNLPELLLLGGTEIDVAEMYRESQRSLGEVLNQVASLNDSLQRQNQEIQQRKIEIENQKKLINDQERSILSQQEEIDSSRKELASLLTEVEQKQTTLNSKIALINEQLLEIGRQETLIESQETGIDQRNNILNELQNDIDEQMQRVENQKSELSSMASLVERQKVALIVFFVFCFLIVGTVFLIYRSYKIKKESNLQLTKMNKAILEQKGELQQRQEEIMAQSEEIKQANEEILSTNEALEGQKNELKLTLENLKLTQAQLLQSEKMASVGQLTAGIAHEINNPVNFISGNVKPLSRDIDDILEILYKYESIIREKGLEESFSEINSLKEKLDYQYLTDEIKKLLDGISEGAVRSSQIVKGLRSFSRIDDEKFKMADLHEGIDSTLILLYNKTKNRIKVHKEYGELPEIDCLPSKLNQVFMNIISNGIQAIEEKGDIFIKTISSGIGIKICIRDTGVGMSTEVKKHIFEPFYTTKDVGKGTGLGLAISYGIIEQHHGNIDVISEPGKGTEFIISLPLEQPDNN